MPNNCIRVGFFFLIILGSILVAGNEIKNKNQEIMILIDFEILHCNLCSEHFIEFLNYANNQTHLRVRCGILVNEGGKGTNINILKKQIKGFKRGYNINFPIFIDQNDIYKCVKQKCDIIITDFESGEISFYKYNNFLKRFN